MNSYLNLLTLPLYISLLITIVLISYTIAHMNRKGAIYFLLTLIAVMIWSGGYIIEIGSRSLEHKIFWANIQFIGIGMLPVAWLLTTLFMIGREDKLIYALTALLPIPLLINILIWTDPWLHLIRRAPSLIQVGPLLLINAHYGGLHNWLFVPFQYFVYGFSLILFTNAWMNARSLYRRRYFLIAVAILVPMIGSAFYIIGVPPFQYINLTPAMFSFSCIFFARAIFTHSMLDILPLARDAVVENLRDGILVFDRQDRLIDYNPAAAKLFPHTDSASIGNPARDVLDGRSEILQQLHDTEDSSEIKFTLDKGNNHRLHYRSCLSLVRNRKQHVIGKALTISNITTQIKLLDKMQKLATTDSLTGVLNRRSFFEHANLEIDRARRYQRPVSFILMDIDHFKRVNDNYGHAAGDAVLVELSERISRAIRQEDLFGRYGGEEFSVCLPETTQSTAYTFAERLRKIVETEPVLYRDQQISITGSFGVVGVDKIRDEDLEVLLLHVDKALYEAKELGRNRCVLYSPQLFF